MTTGSMGPVLVPAGPGMPGMPAGLEGVVTHAADARTFPPRPGRTEPWPAWLAVDVVARLTECGIAAPWRHQVLAANYVRAREHVVLATGTSSGKSLAYLLPLVQNAIDDAGLPRARRRTALYLAPTKALAHDQLRATRELGLPQLRAAALDGDSLPAERDWARGSADYVLTNPDMLHHAILPGHERYRRLLAGLDLVVIDECHHYRGVFGSHVAQVLRRLRRLCRHYGSEPVFVLASATVADPAVAGRRLIGAPLRAVVTDDSPRGELTFALVDPASADFASAECVSAGSADAGDGDRSPHARTCSLVAELVRARARTVAFVRSRRAAETVALATRDALGEPLDRRVAAYRGGLLPEERRALEAALVSGDLLAVASTNALELGIDIAGLDAVVLAGFPGTRASLWQQVGRAGRRGRPALAVLVAGSDPLDHYLVQHPELLFDGGLEATAFDPDNPYVVAPHLAAAAAELPLTAADMPLFGPQAPRLRDELTDAGLLRRRPHGWFWAVRDRATDLADIRGAGAPAVTIVECDTGRLLGTVDAAAAPAAVHEGAVYLHQGEQYLVQALDLDAGVAMVVAAELDYDTTARSVSSLTVEDVTASQAWGAAELSFGAVTVTSQVVGYLRRRAGTGQVLGEVPLDLPERTLSTKAVWWTLTPAAVVAAGIAAADLPGAAHAAEHASIGLLPLFATCDRWDIGGLSTACHADTGTVTVFVHDGYPGGAGMAERGYERAVDWLTATRNAIAGCACDNGCPGCVQSPKCGNGNNPLDKRAAVRLLDGVLADAPVRNESAATRQPA